MGFSVGHGAVPLIKKFSFFLIFVPFVLVLNERLKGGSLLLASRDGD